MNKVLDIKHLKKIYHTPENEIEAITDFSLEIENGEFIAIVGPSGCGKSTLLSILCDIENKTDGEIIFNESSKTGYMLQNDCLFSWLTILDNCLVGLRIKNKISDNDKNKIIELLNNYGLGEFIYKYPTSLSGGMKQRVALIRTLAMNPDIFLLDEPFSALDYQTRLAVSDDVYKIIKDTGKTTIMITHDIAEAISMADRVVVLTKRPSKVKKIYDIKMTNKTTPINNRKCMEFSKYYDMIWKDIDYHVQ